MRTLKISSLLYLILATLSACSGTFSAAPSIDSSQSNVAEAHLNLDNNRSHGW